jgi:hypothetical protein
MESGLSPQNEQYLAEALATGLYPSKEAALDAAISALREKHDEVPSIPEEHMALVEAAIESSDAGQSREMTPDDWEKLRQRVRDVAARHNSGTK